MKNKTRFSAGNLVSQGPRALSTYGVGRMRRLGRVPDALSQIGRLTRHDFRWPLNFPNLIISLARFGQVPEGQLASPGSIYPRTRRPIIDVPGVALMICVGLPIGPDGRHGVCVSFDTTDTQRGSGNDGLPASARLCF